MTNYLAYLFHLNPFIMSLAHICTPNIIFIHQPIIHNNWLASDGSGNYTACVKWEKWLWRYSLFSESNCGRKKKMFVQCVYVRPSCHTMKFSFTCQHMSGMSTQRKHWHSFWIKGNIWTHIHEGIECSQTAGFKKMQSSCFSRLSGPG